MDQLNGEVTVEDFLENDAVYPVVSVYADANTKTFAPYEGEEGTLTYAAILIHLEGSYETSTTIPIDGTTLTVQENGNDKRYKLEDGTLLLTESASIDSALQNVELQPLYNTFELLEQAYAAYKETENPVDFEPFSVSQTTYQTAANEKAQYFETDFWLYTGKGNTTYDSIGIAVDKDTKTIIPTAELFTCPAEEIGTRLLALADLSDANRAAMESAFQPEYVIFAGDSIRIKFPENSLSTQPEAYVVYLEDTESVHALLQDWAIPK